MRTSNIPQAEISKEEGDFVPKAGLYAFKRSKLENLSMG